MTVTPDATVATIAREFPASIRVFQSHHIDFCCGGHIPLAEACEGRHLDVGQVIAELEAADAPPPSMYDWMTAPLSALVAHIQATYHGPLRVELDRLDAMMTKVSDRHGAHLPEVVPPLQRAFSELREELLEHMLKEDRVLFPMVCELQSASTDEPAGVARQRAAILSGPISVMESEHDRAGALLAEMRALTSGYAPPEWACPTFRGLYYGLAQLEADMHVHVHLENNILFPRALASARFQVI
jgi:regulator of cell morphogenesis and NO signaling